MLLRALIALAIVVLRPATALADPASDAASEILKQWGAPGAVIILLGLAVLGLAYKLGKTQDARLDDQREFAKQFVGLSNDYKESTHEIAKTTAAQSVAIDGIAADAKSRWTEAKSALDHLDDKLDPLSNSVAANGSALGRMEADIRDIRNHATGQRPGGNR